MIRAVSATAAARAPLVRAARTAVQRVPRRAGQVSSPAGIHWRGMARKGADRRRALVRTPEYEEPSGGEQVTLLYRLLGTLGGCVAVGSYIWYVYNPGMGSRRFQHYYDEPGDDAGNDTRGNNWGQDPSGSTSDENYYSGNDPRHDEDDGYDDFRRSSEGTYDPYDDTRNRGARGTEPRGRAPHSGSSHEANSRATWT